MDIVDQIRLFIEPRSIALIGVTRRTGDGHNVLENLLSDGYNGKVYPVNPGADTILGVKVCRSISDLPPGIDLALISTPRDQVPQHARECIARGIKALIIVAQGMADVGGEGAALQQELVRVAREGGARVLGPNTFGVANAFLNLNTAFVRFDLYRQSIGAISQTGMFFGGTHRRRLIGKAIDLGNACDIDFADALQYYAADPQVKVIAVYMEDVKDGRKFMKVAREVALQKPIIAIKGGRTPVGGRLTQSHTGSVAGRAEIYDAAFKQCGVIRAADMDELDDLILSFWYLPLPRGRRVAVQTNTMGAGVMATDALSSQGLDMAELAPATKERIARIVPRWLPVRNPVDIGPSKFVEPDGRKIFTESVEALLNDPGVDSVLFILPSRPPPGSDPIGSPDLAQDLVRRYPSKPLVCWVHSADVGEVAAREFMEAENMVAYPTVDRAARALARLANYAAWKQEMQAGGA
ncbi:MAG: CoA-binding protein [Chloroflexi bacterium]|nr:CoA-binding protein [Chloroflexota bacterium]